VALGEVGRPHFPVSPEISAGGTAVFHHALKVAREVGCPVVVHSADLDPAGYAELGAEARKAGLPPDRVVKHYARQRIDPSNAAGVVPSYLARRELVRDVANDPAPWFLETDYLDDPARPGAVLDLTTVPRRARALSEGDAAAGDRLWNPFVRSVERVYGWRPEVDPGATP
jgi:TatD-related deoxyribonuclease